MEFLEWAKIKEDIKKEDTNQETKGFKRQAEKKTKAFKTPAEKKTKGFKTPAEKKTKGLKTPAEKALKASRHQPRRIYSKKFKKIQQEVNTAQIG